MIYKKIRKALQRNGERTKFVEDRSQENLWWIWQEYTHHSIKQPSSLKGKKRNSEDSHQNQTKLKPPKNQISNAILSNCFAKLFFIEEDSMRSCSPKCIVRDQIWWFHSSNSVNRAMEERNS